MKPGDLRFVRRSIFVFCHENRSDDENEEDRSRCLFGDTAVMLIKKGEKSAVMWQVMTHAGVMWAIDLDLESKTELTEEIT